MHHHGGPFNLQQGRVIFTNLKRVKKTLNVGEGGDIGTETSVGNIGIFPAIL